MECFVTNIERKNLAQTLVSPDICAQGLVGKFR